MRCQNESRPMPQGVLNRRQRLPDTRVVHNAPVVQGNVKVDPHEDASAVERKITHGKLGHWLVRPLAGSLECLFVRMPVRSNACSFECLFVRMLVRSNVFRSLFKGM